MLKLKSLSALIATTLVIAPTVFSLPANAQTNIYRTKNSVVAGRRAKKKAAKVERLSDGGIRIPNGTVVPAKKIVKLSNGYMRIPGGHIINPDGDFFDSKDLVVLSNGRRRLPNGVIIVVDD